MRVLVIEDDGELAEAIGAGLRQEQMAVDGAAGTGGQLVTGGDVATACTPPPDSLPTAEQMNACQQAAQAEAASFRDDTLDQLLIESGVALGIMAVVSVGLGWLMAGRVLSPLRTITRAACERALAAGEQQERLIAALLTLARGERGLDTFEPFDLGTIAASALAGLRDETDDRGLAVSAELGAAPALGDPRLAERLVANLADNAVRYNVTGGQVEVATGSRDGRAFLAVTNTGPVIPPDQLGRLFQPFQRLQPGRARPNAGGEGSGQRDGGQGGAGLGLGLAIVSAIAAAHGAELRAVTRAAGGLAVEVIFPRRPAEAADRVQDRAGALV